jgi:hypothetical protein
MKKLFISILSFLYLAASTGATMHMHYCMGRLADTGFFEQEGGHCSLCGMEKSGDDNNGCCNDKAETVKISIDQKYATASIFHFEQPFTLLEDAFTGFQPQLLAVAAVIVFPVSHAPPRSPQVPAYLMNCHFRI